MSHSEAIKTLLPLYIRVRFVEFLAIELELMLFLIRIGTTFEIPLTVLMRKNGYHFGFVLPDPNGYAYPPLNLTVHDEINSCIKLTAPNEHGFVP